MCFHLVKLLCATLILAGAEGRGPLPEPLPGHPRGLGENRRTETEMASLSPLPSWPPTPTPCPLLPQPQSCQLVPAGWFSWGGMGIGKPEKAGPPPAHPLCSPTSWFTSPSKVALSSCAFPCCGWPSSPSACQLWLLCPQLNGFRGAGPLWTALLFEN